MTRLAKCFAVLVLPIALAGCVTQEQREAEFRSKCTSLGAVPNSPEFVQCMTTFITAEAQRRATIASSPD